MKIPSLDSLSERRVSLLVVLFGLVLYLPFMGSYGLYDPWETHYSEVARQMMERGDYISLWWPGAPIDPEHFWSKPVLSFWLMSLSMRVFGLAHADPGTLALSTRAEWAVRMPFALLGVLGIYAVYLCVSRFVSRRAGVIAAVVTATSPLYSLVARQAMTDMAFVGPMTMALALGALALFDDDDTPLPRRELRVGSRKLEWPHHPLFYVAVGLFTITALPQLIFNSIALRWSFKSGFYIPGAAVMLPYIAGFVAFFALVGRIRYKAPLYINLAATLCGLAMLAKGLVGLGLPVLVFIAYLAFTWNWKRLNRAQLPFAILLALLTCAVIAIPWHHAMLVRHGRPFWDELFGDNHWRRLVLGRHGDRGSFEYFVRELGYAILPWIALAPAALGAAVWRRVRAARDGVATDAAETRRQGMFWFGAIWFVAAYALVSMSVTKFHHYILPAVPGLAIAIGCFLDQLLSRRDNRAAAVAAVIGIPLLALVLVDLAGAPKNAQRFIWLFSYDYINSPQGRPWPPALDFRVPLIVFGGLLGAGDAGDGLAAHPARRHGRVVPDRGRVHVFPRRLLHDARDAVLDAEGPHRDLLQAAAVAGGTAAGLADVLARRELLHVERDLRRAEGRTHGVPRRPQLREPQGVDGTPPRAARLHPDRAHPLEHAGDRGAGGATQDAEEGRREQHEVRARVGRPLACDLGR